MQSSRLILTFVKGSENTVRKEMEDDAWSELIGSYHEEGGVISVSGPSGGVQTLGWDSNAYDYGVTHTHKAGWTDG